MAKEKEGIDNQLEQTIGLIEKGLEDIQKNKATKAEVLSLIDERVKLDKEAFNAAKSQAEKATSLAEELKAKADSLTAQIRALQASGFGTIRDGSGGYHGAFGSVQEAKLFGLLLIAAATANTSLKSQHEKTIKSIEKMGVQPIWLDESGRKTMTGVAQTGGSALVTVEQAPGMIQLLETYGVFRRNAARVPMGAGQTTTPKIDSLLTGYCPGEGGEITTSDPTIAVLGLIPKTICYLTGYSMELDEDSAIALAELIGPLMARSMAYDEDRCGFLGDGTSTYFGFKGITAALLAVSSTIANIKSLIVGTGNAYSELVLGDFNKVCGILPQYADEDGNAKWYAHRYFYYTIMIGLALAAGGVTASEVIMGAGQRQKTYLSYPVEFAQVMPKAEANSQICALLANLSLGVMLGTRGGVEFAQSSERYFEKGIIAIRGRNRVAINAHGVGNTTNAGPICGLITAAS